MSAAETEKALGAEAWSSGDYEKAIKHFTNAIDNTVDRELSKLLYSNRSAAYLKTKQNSAALADAKKCVELDNNWVKGHTRYGDALYSLGKYTEAYNAYNAGLRIDSKDKNLIEKAEKTMNAISGAADASSSGGRGGWSSQSSTAYSSSTPSSVTASGILGTIQSGGRLFAIVNAFLYLLPFGQAFSAGSYRRFAFAEITGYLIEIYAKHGLPHYSDLMGYAQRVLPDPVVMRLFLAFLIVSSHPYILALGCLLLVDFTFLTTQIFAYARTQLPLFESRVIPLLSGLAPGIVNQLNLSQLFSQSNVNTVNSKLLSTSATCEVYQGLFLIVELVLPSRNIMFLFLWWQYLQMRYMLDNTGSVRTVFAQLDQQISQLIANPMCPKIVNQGYSFIKKQLAERVKPPTERPQGGAMPSMSSMMSKCTIM